VGVLGNARATRVARMGVLSAVAAVVCGCSGGARQPIAQGRQVDAKYGTSASPRVIANEGQTVPKGGGAYKLGQPYKIAGRWYTPVEDPGYDRSGVASWYGTDFHGRKTANGEVFDMTALTAAHPTLPLPSFAYVTNLANGRTVLVRINDRGPYAHDRLIDLSRQSARLLGTEAQGLGHVRVRYAGRAPLDGNDAHQRQFLAQQPWANGIAAGGTMAGRMGLGVTSEKP
jgi:rare lipoprotein A